MQLHHVGGACGLVEPVHVLGDQAGEVTRPLEPRHGLMAGVRRGQGDVTPPQVTTGPVAPTCHRVGRELPVGHRRHGAARAGGAAVVGDPRLGRDPRAREHHHTAGSDEVDEGREVGRRLWVVESRRHDAIVPEHGGARERRAMQRNDHQ